MYGTCMEHVWIMHGMYGLCMGCMENVWEFKHQCMAHVCHLCIYVWKVNGYFCLRNSSHVIVYGQRMAHFFLIFFNIQMYEPCMAKLVLNIFFTNKCMGYVWLLSLYLFYVWVTYGTIGLNIYYSTYKCNQKRQELNNHTYPIHVWDMYGRLVLVFCTC